MHQPAQASTSTCN
ncbi:hypothetical protein E2C01_075589 [Portunus trituberculatus]|uniref:Uncharacterized protein n=1 Tax=Portunus trituberculatus TaxID=210409 RepID=A0A5B7IGI2_PORTR|nr:hypothetical protein [Portunus trituberculatus]